MKIITAGRSYIDIDAYAGCIAYAELLRAQGYKAQAVSTAPFNESIPPSVRAWGVSLLREYQPQPDDTFTLVDLSNIEVADTFVVAERVDRVIDHHPGFEQFWQERLGDAARIEVVGAACTQVYEEWQRAGLLDQMSETTARLLACGILDNTLNFGARITTDRDHAAYADLKTRGTLPDDWPVRYFTECQATITADLTPVIRIATKPLQLKTFVDPIRASQLALWDAASLVSGHQSEIIAAMTDLEPYWFVNLISISEQKSYFVSDNPATQEWLSQLLGVTFDGQIAAADRMWLRKEITHEDLGTNEL